MIDLYLKFPDEKTAINTLYKSSDVLIPIYTASVDSIGVIYQSIGDMDTEEGFITKPLPGWHINLRGDFTPDDISSLNPFLVFPKNPARVWS